VVGPVLALPPLGRVTRVEPTPRMPVDPASLSDEAAATTMVSGAATIAALGRLEGDRRWAAARLTECDLRYR